MSIPYNIQSIGIRCELNREVEMLFMSSCMTVKYKKKLPLFFINPQQEYLTEILM